MEQAKKDNVPFWDGEIYSLLSHRVNGKFLEITLGLTSYKRTIGTHENNPIKILQRYGKDFLANALVVTTSIVTKDNYLIFGIRAKGIVDSEKLSTFGGSLNKDELVINSATDIIESLHNELHEEIGIGKDILSATRFLGLITDKNLYPQLHFQTNISLTHTEAIKRINYFLKKDEHQAILVTSNKRDALTSLLKQYDTRAISSTLSEHLKLLSHQELI